MFGFNSREPLMTEIMAAIVLFLLSILVVIGTAFKMIGSIIQFIVNIICFLIELVERIKRKRFVNVMNVKRLH